ncbi:uncharacterized protein LOC125141425 [Tachysurus ichikawai]
MVEKHWLGAKDYWQKVGQNGKERSSKRPTDRSSPKNLAGVSIAQPEEAPTSTSRSTQRFIMADGKVHQALEKRTVSYKWHEKQCGVDTYIMKDAHLAFPLIVGLDILMAT